MLFGPQHEPIPETEAEQRMTTAELRAEKHKRDVSADGPGFGPTKTPDSSVASGTDRDKAVSEFAAKIIRGPQGEIIRPVSEQGICPLCQQSWPETCSQPGAEPDGFDDPDNAVVDDRFVYDDGEEEDEDGINELMA